MSTRVMGVAITLAIVTNVQAAIVHRTVNLPIPTNQYGLWLNVENGATTTTSNGPAGWDFNIYTSGAYASGPAAGGANIVLYTGSTNGAGFMRYPGTVGGTPPKLPVGTTVASYGSFGAGTATFGAQEGAWKLNDSNLVGFRFKGADGLTRHGWARVVVGATSTDRILSDYAFESTPDLCVACGATGGAPPSNCASAPPYDPCAATLFACTVGENLPIFNVTTTVSLDLSSCGGAGFVLHRANWYPFDVPATGLYLISLCGNATDTRLAVLDACSPSAGVVACNDDFCTAAAAVTVQGTAGQRLWIVAGTASATSGAPTFLPVSIAPPYDPCGQAPLIASGTTAVPTSSAVPALDMTGHCNSGSVHEPIIHKANYAKWIAPSSGYFAFGVCPATTNVHVAVMTECADPSSVIACSYDRCPASSGARVGFWAIGGTTYTLAYGVVDPIFAQPTVTNLTIDAEPPPPDPCGTDLEVAVLGLQSIRIDMDFPDLSMVGTPCTYANGQQKLFYPTFFRFTAPATGLYSMGNCSDTDPHFWGIYDLRLAVMTTCGDVSTLLACDDNGCNGNVPPWTSRITDLALTAGQTVYIAIAGGDVAAPGPFAFELSLDHVTACTGDLDANGVIDGADLGSMLSAWGPCGTSGCVADGDGSGSVDGADLGILLSAWGPCAP
ncbi:MAG: hypothetical protein FJ254_06915 [Phycisphaerae bacterium]|nr:hypothetical protein [Phycisphaerae bacterium]